jgi:hypothetical protein
MPHDNAEILAHIQDLVDKCQTVIDASCEQVRQSQATVKRSRAQLRGAGFRTAHRSEVEQTQIVVPAKR